jgi:predicted methyltransferase
MRVSRDYPGGTLFHYTTPNGLRRLGRGMHSVRLSQRLFSAS